MNLGPGYGPSQFEEEPAQPPQGMVYPEAPFQLGQHLCVVQHAAFLQCLDCICQTGKVKGEYNFAYLTGQDCRKLKKKKVKVRPTSFLATENRSTGSGGDPPAGYQASGLTDSPGNQESGITGSSGEVSPGSTGGPAATRSGVPTVRSI
eukprot:3426777-Amphidinium_carterae.1